MHCNEFNTKITKLTKITKPIYFFVIFVAFVIFVKEPWAVQGQPVDVEWSNTAAWTTSATPG